MKFPWKIRFPSNLSLQWVQGLENESVWKLNKNIFWRAGLNAKEIELNSLENPSHKKLKKGSKSELSYRNPSEICVIHVE